MQEDERAVDTKICLWLAIIANYMVVGHLLVCTKGQNDQYIIFTGSSFLILCNWEPDASLNVDTSLPFLFYSLRHG